MVTYASNRDQSHLELPPVLIAGSSQQAIDRAEAVIAMSGVRIGGRCQLDEARDRIEQQAAASAVWIELDRDAGDSMDSLISFVAEQADSGRFAAIVSGSPETLDPLAACLGETGVELIIGADEQQRAAALAVTLARRSVPSRLSDIAADKNAARLRQLSEEVSRIASTLARLSTGPASSSPRPVHLADQDPASVSAETVRGIIRARRLRARYFSEELFADPAWDMMLDLLQAEISHLRVPVSSLCIAAAVPATTALRWLKTMVHEGIFVRRADPHDGRRAFVELSPDASRALRRYFNEVAQVAVV